MILLERRAMLVFLPLMLLAAQHESVTISPGVADERGVIVQRVESPYQRGTTEIRVLQPEGLQPDEKLPVIYVLPVEAGRESRYGDGLTEIQQRGLVAKHRVLFVAPTFSQLPWYADHPTDPLIRQETYLLKVVLPYIERTYPVRAERSGRLLLGFSKSGWGAWSLLLRQPDTFARAAVWDAPLMLDAPGKYGSGPIFGDDATFARYRLSDLVRERAGQLQGEPRLILIGAGNFHDEHVRMRTRLDELRIPYIDRDLEPLKHDWHSGWVADAVNLLLKSPAMAQ